MKATKTSRKLVLSAVAGALSVSMVALSAPGAHADTSWGRGSIQSTGGR